MDLFLSEFISGFHDALTAKKAEDIFGTPNNTSIFPTIETQAKWHFARTANGLHLNDGQKVHAFHFETESHEDDFPLQKVEDIPFHEFGEGSDYKGTAQVHKANPGMLYLTLHDGKENPTYTFKHVNEDQWRAIPKVKKAEAPIPIDETDFLKGLTDKVAEGFGKNILDGTLKGMDWLGRKTINGVMKPGYDPLLAAGLGLAGGAAYDIGKRTLYNTDEENAEEGFGQRAARYIAPAALLGGTGAVTRNLFQNYYNHSPLYIK